MRKIQKYVEYHRDSLIDIYRRNEKSARRRPKAAVARAETLITRRHHWPHTPEKSTPNPEKLTPYPRKGSHPAPSKFHPQNRWKKQRFSRKSKRVHHVSPTEKWKKTTCSPLILSLFMNREFQIFIVKNKQKRMSTHRHTSI